MPFPASPAAAKRWGLLRLPFLAVHPLLPSPRRLRRKGEDNIERGKGLPDPGGEGAFAEETYARGEQTQDDPRRQ